MPTGKEKHLQDLLHPDPALLQSYTGLLTLNKGKKEPSDGSAIQDSRVKRVMKKPLLTLPLISSSHERETKTQNKIKSKSQTEMAQEPNLPQELLRETCLATPPADLGIQEEGAQPCSWAEPGLTFPLPHCPRSVSRLEGKATFPPLSRQENSNHKQQFIAPGSQLEPPFSPHSTKSRLFSDALVGFSSWASPQQ